MKRYKNLFFFLITVLIMSSISFMKNDIERLFVIESQADTISLQDLNIEELEIKLIDIEIRLKEKGNDIDLLIQQNKILKKIIEREKNRKHNNSFIILDSLSVNTGTDGRIIEISK